MNDFIRNVFRFTAQQILAKINFVYQIKIYKETASPNCILVVGDMFPKLIFNPKCGQTVVDTVNYTFPLILIILSMKYMFCIYAYVLFMLYTIILYIFFKWHTYQESWIKVFYIKIRAQITDDLLIHIWCCFRLYKNIPPHKL